MSGAQAGETAGGACAGSTRLSAPLRGAGALRSTDRAAACQGRIQPGTPREEILLQCLAALAAAKAPVPRSTGATNTHIHIQKDETIGQAVIQTQHGPKKLSRAELGAAECDAVITEPGKRNRSTIPPSVRRAVLTRDQHRCRTPGCRNAHFLEIHHIAARQEDGTNDPRNLVTLCAACHRRLHERMGRGMLREAIERGVRESGETVCSSSRRVVCSPKVPRREP